MPSRTMDEPCQTARSQVRSIQDRRHSQSLGFSHAYQWLWSASWRITTHPSALKRLLEPGDDFIDTVIPPVLMVSECLIKEALHLAAIKLSSPPRRVWNAPASERVGLAVRNICYPAGKRYKSLRTSTNRSISAPNAVNWLRWRSRTVRCRRRCRRQDQLGYAGLR